MRTIAVIGSINTDLVVEADTLPREGETVLGRGFRVVCGGKGANQAVAAAALGGRVHMVGCVGSDEYGRLAKENLERRGVGVRAVRSVAGPSGVALIVVDRAGRNLIAVAPNANAQVSVPRRPFDIVVMQLETPYVVPRARLFILNPAPANLEALRRGAAENAVGGGAARRGAVNARTWAGRNAAAVRTVAQSSARRRGPLSGVDVVIPNEHEAEALTGKRDPRAAARELVRMGAGRVIITLGAAGVLDAYSDADRPRLRRAFRVKVVDTVGAGDAFVGAFAAAVADGHADPVAFAQAAAALKCTKPGAQSVPTRVAVERLLGGAR